MLGRVSEGIGEIGLASSTLLNLDDGYKIYYVLLSSFMYI